MLSKDEIILGNAQTDFSEVQKPERKIHILNIINGTEDYQKERL
jgi:hypothetical protein